MESQMKFVTGSVGPTRVRLQHGYIVENNVCRPRRVHYERQKETPSSPDRVVDYTWKYYVIVVVSQNNIFFISKRNCFGHVLYYPLTLSLLEWYVPVKQTHRARPFADFRLSTLPVLYMRVRAFNIKLKGCVLYPCSFPQPCRRLSRLKSVELPRKMTFA